MSLNTGNNVANQLRFINAYENHTNYTPPVQTNPVLNNTLQNDTFVNSSKTSNGKFDYSIDDGKISLKDKMLNFAKGIVAPVTAMFSSPKNFAIGALAIAGGAVLIAATGGAAAPVMVALGVVGGGIELTKSIYKAANAKTDDDAKSAWQGIGTGTTFVAGSIAGSKAALKTAGVETEGLGFLKATFECFKQTPASVGKSVNAFTSGEALLNLKKAFHIKNKENADTNKIENESKNPVDESVSDTTNNKPNPVENTPEQPKEPKQPEPKNTELNTDGKPESVSDKTPENKAPKSENKIDKPIEKPENKQIKTKNEAQSLKEQNKPENTPEQPKEMKQTEANRTLENNKANNENIADKKAVDDNVNPSENKQTEPKNESIKQNEPPSEQPKEPKQQELENASNQTTENKPSEPKQQQEPKNTELNTDGKPESVSDKTPENKAPKSENEQPVNEQANKRNENSVKNEQVEKETSIQDKNKNNAETMSPKPRPFSLEGFRDTSVAAFNDIVDKYIGNEVTLERLSMGENSADKALIRIRHNSLQNLNSLKAKESNLETAKGMVNVIRKADFFRGDAKQNSKTTLFEAMNEIFNMLEKNIQEKCGVDILTENVGATFDENLMYAVEKIQTKDKSLDNIVVKVFNNGYVLNGEAISKERVAIYEYVATPEKKA